VPNAIPLRSTSRFCGNYSRATDVSRLLEIFQNAGQTALESKNRGTAQNDFELAIEAYYQIVVLHPGSALEQSITQKMQMLAGRFPSRACINEAVGICEKANKLKSIKAKLKYLLKAREVLECGLARQDAERAKITSIYDQVISYFKQAEAIIAKRSEKTDSSNTAGIIAETEPIPLTSEFKFSCPNCAQHILVPTSLVGTVATCPTCGHELLIPQPTG
jgi:hypothetical protein